MKRLLAVAGMLWCRFWHHGIHRGGRTYCCAVRLREYAYPWTGEEQVGAGVWRQECADVCEVKGE